MTDDTHDQDQERFYDPNTRQLPKRINGTLRGEVLNAEWFSSIR